MDQVLAALLGAAVTAVVSIWLHIAQRKKHTDKEILFFFRCCLDRPALKTPFEAEVSEEDFRQAIENTITAINTGTLLHRKDRLVLAQSGNRHLLEKKDYRQAMADVEHILQQILTVYRQAEASKKIRVFEYQGSYHKPDRDPTVCAQINQLRSDLLAKYNALADKEDIDPINTVTIVAESKSISHIESASDDEKEHAPGEILRKLEDPHLSDSARQGLIIEAEVLDFTGDQAVTLTALLRQFIDDHRESNVPSDLVAVASAIRKFVATADPGEAFDYAASLLGASGRSPLPIELELEVTKMVVRKLTANPPVSDESFPELAARLNKLANKYLNPHLLAREKHGAVALNAVLGLVLTRDRVANVIDRVHGLGVAWFLQLVGRRASRVKTELEQRGSDDRYRDLLQSLDELSLMVSENTST